MTNPIEVTARECKECGEVHVHLSDIHKAFATGANVVVRDRTVVHGSGNLLPEWFGAKGSA